MKVVSGILAIFVLLPIWYYLLYKILVLVNATEVMFFLFWVYLPVSLFINLIAKLTED